MGQTDPVALFPSKQPSGEDQSDSSRVDGSGHGGPDGPVRLAELCARRLTATVR